MRSLPYQKERKCKEYRLRNKKKLHSDCHFDVSQSDDYEMCETLNHYLLVVPAYSTNSIVSFSLPSTQTHIYIRVCVCVCCRRVFMCVRVCVRVLWMHVRVWCVDSGGSSLKSTFSLRNWTFSKY